LGGRRGRLISTPDRHEAVKLIDEAVVQGSRLFKACGEIGICQRTYRRWHTEEKSIKGDHRPNALRPLPANALTPEEKEEIVKIACSSEFASLPPSQIVPKLADKGRYIASESSFYRVLREKDLQHHRGRSSYPSRSEPERHVAHAPNELWSWDITWLPGPVVGTFFYLYLVLDIFSRKIVGWEVCLEETADQASKLIRRTSLSEGRCLKKTVLHSDNGSPMKGATMLATLHALGISPSYSRPGVSDDNAQVEAFFRTLKYRPGYPSNGFSDLQTAQQWVMNFAVWYNTEHAHSALKFVTPNQRHQGEDEAILLNRKEVYEKAKQRHPQRWSRDTRNWERPGSMWLNSPQKTAILSKEAA
jgi:putative transposase